MIDQATSEMSVTILKCMYVTISFRDTPCRVDVAQRVGSAGWRVDVFGVAQVFHGNVPV